MILGKVILAVTMLYIAWEDFRHREVSLYSFIVFMLAAFIYAVGSQGYKNTFSYGILNLALVIFQLTITWLWFALIKRTGREFLNKIIGVGDLIFYIPVIFLFSPLNFVCIHLLGLLFILIVFASYRIVVAPVKTIPLAGGLSIFMVIVLLLSWVYQPDFLYDDMYLTDLLYTLKL